MTGKQRERLEDYKRAYGHPSVVLESQSGRHVVAVWHLPSRPGRRNLIRAIRLIGPDGNAIPLHTPPGHIR